MILFSIVSAFFGVLSLLTSPTPTKGQLAECAFRTEVDCTDNFTDPDVEYFCYVDANYSGACQCQTTEELDVVFLFSLADPTDIDYPNANIFYNFAELAAEIITASLPNTARIGIYTYAGSTVTEYQSLTDSESNTDTSQSAQYYLDLNFSFVGGRENGGYAVNQVIPQTFADTSEDATDRANVLVLISNGEDESATPDNACNDDGTTTTAQTLVDDNDVRVIVVAGDGSPGSGTGTNTNYNCLNSSSTDHISIAQFRPTQLQSAMPYITSAICTTSNPPTAAPSSAPSNAPSAAPCMLFFCIFCFVLK